MTKSIKKAIIGSTIAASTLMTSASMIYAQGVSKPAPRKNLGFLEIKQGEGGVESISVLISSVFNIAILIAIIFVFFMLILGGYGWITAGGDKTKVEEARSRITNALIGLAIVAAAWALINVISQFFGFNLTNITIPDASLPSPNDAL